ncbi:uncharacterized protein LOC106012369 [Aplysia californica]|uniref:Uncharacterized protein LOC106012369 n=1 Tax=Aplysia californica TaxID=6500 RepID=A0ABM1A4D7_APLCA|nr:uncharacterized protein LOC106012369 [Aplysia californica]
MAPAVVFYLSLHNLHEVDSSKNMDKHTVVSAFLSFPFLYIPPTPLFRQVYLAQHRHRLEQLGDRPYLHHCYPEIPPHRPGTWHVYSWRDIDTVVERLYKVPQRWITHAPRRRATSAGPSGIRPMRSSSNSDVATVTKRSQSATVTNRSQSATAYTKLLPKSTAPTVSASKHRATYKHSTEIVSSTNVRSQNRSFQKNSLHKNESTLQKPATTVSNKRAHSLHPFDFKSRKTTTVNGSLLGLLDETESSQGTHPRSGCFSADVSKESKPHQNTYTTRKNNKETNPPKTITSRSNTELRSKPQQNNTTTSSKGHNFEKIGRGTSTGSGQGYVSHNSDQNRQRSRSAVMKSSKVDFVNSGNVSTISEKTNPPQPRNAASAALLFGRKNNHNQEQRIRRNSDSEIGSKSSPHVVSSIREPRWEFEGGDSDSVVSSVLQLLQTVSSTNGRIRSSSALLNYRERLLQQRQQQQLKEE